MSGAISLATQAAYNKGEVDWGIAAIDGLFGAISAMLWMVPGLGPIATGLINAGLTAVNGVITTGIEKDWHFTLMDGVAIVASAALSGFVSGASRDQFIKAGGRKLLEDTHKLVGTVSGRIMTGYYNNGVDIFSKSFKSAVGQMFKSLNNVNFSKGFYKDWIITGLQAIFATSFAMGLNSLKW